jgi:transposase
VLASTYADHLPLYCQAEIYAREAVDLDRSTLADWIGSASKLLGPLVDHVRQHVFAATKDPRRRYSGAGALSRHGQD